MPRSGDVGQRLQRRPKINLYLPQRIFKVGAVGVAIAPAEVEAQDAVRFQHYIFQSQFPQDCSTTTGVLTRAGLKEGQERWPGDYFYGLGLGSQMASLKFNFAKSLLSGRVY